MAAPSQADNAVLFYEKRSGQYDFTWHSDFTKRFNEYLDIQPGQHVLDLACGTGLLTLLEAERVGPAGKAIGVDITPGMLKQANAKKEAGGEKFANVEFYQGDILDLESVEAVKGQTFDVITVASALVLLPDPKAAVRYWTKFLKPGGVLATDSTHPRNLVSGIVLERVSRRLDLPKPYFREWSTSEHALREVLESGGLEVEKVVTIENQSGYGKRYYEDSDWDDHFVEKVIVGDVSRTFTNHDTRKKAQVIFKEEWEKLSINGRIEEVDSVFLGIARKRKCCYCGEGTALTRFWVQHSRLHRLSQYSRADAAAEKSDTSAPPRPIT
jgi:ubiquinone/menaquinone biosynthesis C-methylase UbiE